LPLAIIFRAFGAVGVFRNDAVGDAPDAFACLSWALLTAAIMFRPLTPGRIIVRDKEQMWIVRRSVSALESIVCLTM